MESRPQYQQQTFGGLKISVQRTCRPKRYALRMLVVQLGCAIEKVVADIASYLPLYLTCYERRVNVINTTGLLCYWKYVCHSMCVVHFVWCILFTFSKEKVL
ncbi:hypothetical protein AVEN_105949-1 [Araneus ventricosus]|uniref:Uncharacterized protein n=1 Tax=Araneus ventricosus TaxID=182803 RepID=A0A4Y2DV07_ARAVE|nr:hypothetical protein AVEN_105949-1 [Araneus ventricosus]